MPASIGGGVKDQTAYAELQDIIRACLSLDHDLRPAAQEVQERLYGIMCKRGWSTNLLAPERVVAP